MKKTLIYSLALLSFSFLAQAYGCTNKNTKQKTQILYAQKTDQNVLEEKENQQFVKIALLLDTSNSMDGLINQAKAQLWEIVNEFTYAKCGNQRPSLQIALYEYGNNNLSLKEGYVRKVQDFSSDLDTLSEKLFALTTNGGEEYCGTVINTSLNDLTWGNNANDLKLIFIAGNEPFDQGNLPFKDATAQANEKQVVVNTIYCGDFNQGIATHWQKGATLTGGDYMAINHNQTLAYVSTPYDQEIMRLNQKLNKTYVAYGAKGSAKAAAQKKQDTNAYALEAAVAVNRTISKSSSFYKNATWDLVDAAEEELEISNDDLPKELQDKSAKEITQFIQNKKKEREAIQKQITALSNKRKAYLATQKTTNETDLKNVMLQAIKRQAAEKNYSWEK